MSVEALGRIDVALAHDAVAEAAGAGFEPPMHRAAGMERLGELGQRAVKDLDRIAARVIELQNLEHAALVGFVLGTDAALYSGFGQLPLHLREFVGAGDAKAQVCEVVAAVSMQRD